MGAILGVLGVCGAGSAGFCSSAVGILWHYSSLLNSTPLSN